MMPALNLGCFPFTLRFCESQAQWNREVKNICIDKDAWKRRWVNEGANATAFILVGKNGTVSFIISIDRQRIKKLRGSLQAAIAAHEAVHVFDWMMEKIGENPPRGSELSAYQIQEITEWTLRHMWKVKK